MNHNLGNYHPNVYIYLIVVIFYFIFIFYICFITSQRFINVFGYFEKNVLHQLKNDLEFSNNHCGHYMNVQ